MGIARFYVEDHNKDGATFPGVPLRDIEDAEWDNYPEWLQRSVDASSMYRKTKPQTAPHKAEKDEPVTERKV